ARLAGVQQTFGHLANAFAGFCGDTACDQSFGQLRRVKTLIARELRSSYWRKQHVVSRVKGRHIVELMQGPARSGATRFEGSEQTTLRVASAQACQGFPHGGWMVREVIVHAYAAGYSE